MTTSVDNELNLRLRELGKELGRVPTPAEREAVKRELEGKAIRGNGTHPISQKDLFAMKLKPPQFLVEDLLISPGLCLLGGRKKSNKSWLALDLSQRVASETPFLGRRVKRGKVFYYALEDSWGRLQDRLGKLKTDATLPVFYMTEIPPLNSEAGMTELENVLSTQKPALTIIDTLASATDKTLDENKASDMGDLMNQLRTLAIKTDSCILILLHHGKRITFDPGFDYRGSSAIPSASDVNISLYKSGESHVLSAEGRDIIDTTLKLRFDVTTWTFQLSKQDSRTERRTEIEDTIIEVIGERGKVDAHAIGTELQISRIAAREYLNDMVAKNQLVSEYVKTDNARKVVFSLPETTVTPENEVTEVTNLQTDKVDSKSVTIVRNESKVTEVSNVSDKEVCKKVTSVTPISEVNEPEKESKPLGQQVKQEWPDCLKTDGYCKKAERRYVKSFNCSETPAQCPFFKVKQ
jgi:hypothetical protein